MIPRIWISPVWAVPVSYMSRKKGSHKNSQKINSGGKRLLPLIITHQVKLEQWAEKLSCRYVHRTKTSKYTWPLVLENYLSLHYIQKRTHLRHDSRSIEFFAVVPSIQTAFLFQVCEVDIYARKESLGGVISDHIQFVSAATARFLLPINNLI